MLSSLEELNVAGPSPNATVAAPWRAQSMTLALGALDDRHARRGGHELRVGEHAAGPARVAGVATQREVVGVELDDVVVRVRRGDGRVASSRPLVFVPHLVLSGVVIESTSVERTSPS